MKVYHVRLSEKAKETIAEEICFTDFESKESNDGFRETSGWLWSSQGAGWWGSSGIEVVEASGPGLNAVKSYDEVTMPFEYVEDLDALFRREGLELCGGWHREPSGDGIPSEVDLKRIGYVLGMRAIWGCRTQRALEIIFTRKPGFGLYDHAPGYDAWCWVFYRGPGGILGRTAIWPEGAILHLEREY